jgi:hypothetical protein
LASRLALVNPTFLTRGFTGERARAHLERARALCDSITTPAATIRVLAGLRTFYFVSGEIRLAREIADQMLKIAARSPDDFTNYHAHLASGYTAAWMGELMAAQKHLERVLAIPETTVSATIAGSGPPLSSAIGVHSEVLWMRGYPDRALAEHARVRGMLGRAFLFERASIMAQILRDRCYFLRDYRSMRPQVEAALAFARENAFAAAAGQGLALLGRILVSEANFVTGVESIREGVRVLKAEGYNPMYGFVLSVLG